MMRTLLDVKRILVVGSMLFLGVGVYLGRAHTVLSGAVVPTTFTASETIAPGGSMGIPIPLVPHDLRLVMAVQPSFSEPPGDPDHGVAAIDLIRNGGLMSFTGIDGHCRNVCVRNVQMPAGTSMLTVNLSGTILLQAGPPGMLYVVNTGSVPRTVHARWTH